MPASTRSPRIIVRVVKPGTKIRPKKLPPGDNGFRGDMAQFYPLKALIEQLLGTSYYRKIKESGSLTEWRKALQQILRAIGKSIDFTVHVVDQEWRDEVAALLDEGRESIRHVTNAAGLFASLSTTLIKLSFLQIGYLPQGRGRMKTVPIDDRHWNLSRFRTVQYVQDAQQAELLRAKQDQLATAKRLTDTSERSETIA